MSLFGSKPSNAQGRMDYAVKEAQRQRQRELDREHKLKKQKREGARQVLKNVERGKW